LVRVDQADEALHLLRWAENLGGPPPAPRARAKANFMRALALQHRGAIAQSAASVVRAFLADPLFVYEMFIGGATMLVRARLTRPEMSAR
jgi:hypothetical protein